MRIVNYCCSSNWTYQHQLHFKIALEYKPYRIYPFRAAAILEVKEKFKECKGGGICNDFKFLVLTEESIMRIVNEGCNSNEISHHLVLINMLLVSKIDRIYPFRTAAGLDVKEQFKGCKGITVLNISLDLTKEGCSSKIFGWLLYHGQEIRNTQIEDSKTSPSLTAAILEVKERLEESKGITVFNYSQLKQSSSEYADRIEWREKSHYANC